MTSGMTASPCLLQAASTASSSRSIRITRAPASTPMMGFASLYSSYGEPLGEMLYGRL